MSAYADLLTMLKSVASDPELATDEGHDIMDGKGNAILYVAQPPATEEDLRRAEEAVGFPLPDLLRAIYREVGNGGFGPGYGLLSIPAEGVPASPSGNLLAEFRAQQVAADADSPDWQWPAGLLPICHWGCGINSCVDCAHPDAPVVRCDPNADDADFLTSEGKTLEQWLRAWLNDEELFEMGAA